MTKRGLLVLGCGAAVLPFSLPASGQLLAARENPFAAGHHHLNVTDVETHRQFWSGLLRGQMAQFHGTDVVKFPDTLLFLRKQDPTGASNGSTVNHLGFRVPDLKAVVDRLQGAGIEMVTGEVVSGADGPIFHNTDQDVYLAFAKGPDGVRVELMEDRGVPGIVSHHIHIFTTDDAATRDWYVRHFGGKPGMRGRFRKADVPGVELTFAPAAGDVAPTKGRVIDHIGFEVDDLESFCARLEADGVRFDIPFRRVESLGLSVAFLTDPWGTYIELTEGLDSF